MPNPQGTNGQGVYQPDQPYGQIKRLQQLVQQAPLAPNSALTAPRRAQRRATRPQGRPQQQATPTQPQAVNPAPPPVETPYPTMLAQIVSQIEGVDGTLPNITWLAQQATKEANG